MVELENRPKFCMFLAPNFFGKGRAPRSFGLSLSNPTSFRACGKVSRRSVEGPRREPGEIKKTARVKQKNGRPKNQQNTRILHDSCPKNYQNTPNFYDIYPKNLQNSRILDDFCQKNARILPNNCPKSIFPKF